MLKLRIAPFGLGMWQESTLHHPHTRCFVREELNFTLSEQFGNVRCHLHVKSSCGWLCNTDCGRRIEGRDMVCKTKHQNATSMIKRKTRSTTSCSNVCFQGKCGTNAWPGWDWGWSFAQHTSLAWCNGGRKLGNAYISKLGKDLTHSWCSSAGHFGSRGMRKYSDRVKSRMNGRLWTWSLTIWGPGLLQEHLEDDRYLSSRVALGVGWRLGWGWFVISN